MRSRVVEDGGRLARQSFGQVDVPPARGEVAAPADVQGAQHAGAAGQWGGDRGAEALGALDRQLRDREVRVLADTLDDYRLAGPEGDSEAAVPGHPGHDCLPRLRDAATSASAGDGPTRLNQGSGGEVGPQQPAGVLGDERQDAVHVRLGGSPPGQLGQGLGLGPPLLGLGEQPRGQQRGRHLAGEQPQQFDMPRRPAARAVAPG